MRDADQPILVYTTLETLEDAKQLGRDLVDARLAACVNILAPMTAIYEWEGALQENQETPMLIKSRLGLQEELLRRAKDLHPYETPALLVLEPSGGDREFCSWITAQTRGEA